MPIEVRGLTSIDLGRKISDQVKAFTTSTFEQVLAREVLKGFDRQPIVITDGQVRKDYALVRPFGRIEARARAQLGDAVAWFLDELRRLSPVLTGRYRDSHVVIVDGQIVTDLGKLQAGQKVMIANIQPYAGKIEGKDAYTRWRYRTKTRLAERKAAGWKPADMRGQSKKAPNGVYWVALRNLRKRFGKSVAAFYEPRELSASVISVVMMKRKGGGKLRRQVYPTVVMGVLN